MESCLRFIFKILGTIYFNFVYKKKISKRNYFPAARKLLASDDLQNLIDATLDMWLTSGRFNKEFEAKFAKYLDVQYVLTTNSGSSANLLALTSLTSPLLKERQVKKGDEVITVAAGFPTTINAIIQNDLVPVFVDVEIGTYNALTDMIEKAITPKTKVIMLAHTLGNMFDIEKIQEICKKYNLWLIEDSCDALGSKYKDKYAGTIGDIGTYSFYPAHHITMGEGGAVVTNNPVLKKIILSFRDWGRDCCCPPGCDGVCGKRFSQQFGNLPYGYDHKYVYSHAGYNLKITDWQAAIGCSQLNKLPKFIEKRRNNFKLLYDKLSDLKEYLILPTEQPNSEASWFGFLISVKSDKGIKKQELVEYLEKNGVGTRQLFGGNILRQPYFIDNDIKIKINNSGLLSSKDLTDNDYQKLPNTEYIMNNTFWVGVHPSLGKKEIQKISDTIHSFIEEKSGV